MRNGRREIYQDIRSADLWGPRLSFETNFYGAGRVCS
jgi:hypothetical protein